MAEEFTAKFKVDISDLKKNISEANKQIKLANATFKSETAGMEDWSKNADGLSSKLKQLDTVLSEQKSKLASYKQQLDKQKEAYQENGNRAEQLKAKLKELANQGISKTSQEYKQYETALKNVVKEQQNNKKAIDNLNLQILEQEGAVKKTEAEIGKYETSLSTLNDEQKKAEEAANKQKTAYEELESTIDSQQTELNELKSKYSDVVLEQGKNSDSAKELAGEIDKLSGELSDNKAKLNDADKAADELDQSLVDVGDSAKEAGGGLDTFKIALGNLIADGIRAATQALKDFVTETINVGKEFDSSMSQVAAVSGATGDDLQALRDKAKEMGSTTKFTASEAADAFNYMAMAGWKTEDMLGGINGILSLAAAGNTDLATTSDIVTDALTAFGQSADQAGRLADIMAAASSNANTNVELMGETFKYVAPVAGAMGYSMEDSAVAIGLMANAGIKGSQAGTSLRSILTRLAAPPKEAANAMEALGIEITNTDGTMKPFSEVIDILRKKFDGLSEAEQTQMAKHLAGQQAMSGLLAIVNAAPADFEKLKSAVNDSSGAAEEMAEVMQDNLGGDLTKLGSQFEGVQLTLYEKFEPALRSGVEALSKMLDGISWVIDKISEFSKWLNSGSAASEAFKVVVIAVTAAVSAFLAVLAAQAVWTGLISLLGKAKTAFLALNAVMAANPIGLVIAAVAALVAAFVYLWNNCEEFREFWINLWDKIKEITSEVWDAIVEFFTEAWETIKNVWSAVVNFFAGIWAGIKKVFNSVKTWFSQKFTAAYNAVKSAFSQIGSYFAERWAATKQAFATAREWFSEKFTSAYTAVREAFANIGTYFSEKWQAVKNAFGSVKKWFGDKFGDAWEAIKEKFAGWASFWGDLWETVKQKFSSLGTSISNAIGGAIKSGINSVIGLIENTINSAFGLINGAIRLINKLPGVNVGEIGGISLPRLSQGGILRKGQVGLLEGSGAEAVIPLDKNKMWIRSVAGEMLSQLQGPAGGVINNNRSNSRVSNFTQNIYAPKQPSRIELYRQTKNLLALADGRF